MSVKLLFSRAYWIGILLLHSTVSSILANSTKDSVKTVNRYIRPTLYTNSYATPWRDLQSPFLERYKFKQTQLGFYAPLLTRSWFKKDSITQRTFHLLFTANTQTCKPFFEGLDEQTKIFKGCLGVRLFYTSGKNVWFYQISPFFASDKTSLERPTWRMLSNFVYSRTVSERFSYRIGYTRTFLFGKKYSLPILGFRVGPLDNTHFLFQFPRNMQLRFPISKKNWGSVFLKANGSVSNIANQDSLFPVEPGKSLQLRRNEMNLGFEWYARLSPSVTMQLASGFAGRRTVALALENNRGKFDEPFYYENLTPSLFLNLGFTIRFGKAKSVKNNYTLYEVFDLNQSYEGENNGPADSGIPAKEANLNKIKFKDVEDLMLEE